ncbi:type I DNA topoisomerase [bacterium]|nr:type I DNA topoisomerase [bacterium]
MGKSLVIVESDAKSKTINRFLGRNYVVRASVGHIKNLPKNRLGVDIQNGFEPEYITIRGRGKTLSGLKKLSAESDHVYLATDPDREGEAIAAHLEEELRNSNKHIRRVLFHEITEQAVRDSIKKAHQIDVTKVEAQKARRVMDRLVGYEVSPFLWKTIYRGLSAGRVQSVALRLICEREDEISRFTSREYWSITAEFKTERGEKVTSRLVKIDGAEVEIPNEKEAKSHSSQIRRLAFKVSDLRSKETERNPFPPYTTSTMQQDAVRRLGMSTKQIMALAQQLYEGVDLPEGRVGLITYMRTDSTRMSHTAVEEARRFIAENYGLEYVPQKPRAFRNKKTAQDAHEAIRPTSLARPPSKVAAHLNPNQKKLYELIWNRFVACQMAPARITQMALEIAAGPYLFRTTGSIVKFKGFMQLYQVELEEEENSPIPALLRQGDRLSLEHLREQQHFTKPPPRYNESSLVKELDNLGIGRPSTYALIISTLLDRKYVHKESRSLAPTELGMTVKRIVTSQFPDIFNVGFTAQMEEELDQIESGEKGRVDVLNDFYGPFKQSVSAAMDRKEEIRESLRQDTEGECPKCGRPLVIKWGRNGRFIACTGYPECRHTQPLEKHETAVDEKCDACGSDMVIRTGRFGRFLACSRYPDCKSTRPVSTGVACPEDGCGGRIVEKRSGRGKVFFGCSNYPRCKFASWHRPVPEACKQCGNPFLEERFSKAKGAFLKCPKCKHETAVETPDAGVKET